MKILVLTGYAGFTKRTHNICELLNNDAPVRVIKYAYGKSNFDWLKNTKANFYEKIYCIDHIYEEIESNLGKIKEKDEIEINNLIKKLNLNLTKILYSERVLVQHTHYNFFRKKFNQNEINYFLLKIFKHLEKSLEGVDLIYTYHSSSIFSYLLSVIAKLKNIKFKTLRHDGISNNFFFSDNNSQMLTKETIDIFKASQADQNSLELVQNYIQNLESQNRSNIIIRGQFQKQENLKLNFKNFYRFIKNFFINKDNEIYLQKNNYQRIYEKFYLKYNQYRSTLDSKNNINNKFKLLYLPLQTAPETGVLRSAIKFYDPLSLIKSLSLYIPPNWKLIVKEHPGMIGKRPYQFYEEVKKIYNVELININFHSLSLIQKCDAVISISGNSGLESYALGKKTILLGSIFYEILDNMTKINELDDMYELLKNLEEDYTKKNKLKHKNELAKLLFAIRSSAHIKNDNDELWSSKSFNENELTTDLQIANSLKGFLN